MCAITISKHQPNNNKKQTSISNKITHAESASQCTDAVSARQSFDSNVKDKLKLNRKQFREISPHKKKPAPNPHVTVYRLSHATCNQRPSRSLRRLSRHAPSRSPILLITTTLRLTYRSARAINLISSSPHSPADALTPLFTAVLSRSSRPPLQRQANNAHQRLTNTS